MTAVRKDIHWLPVKVRIEVEMLGLAYNAYHGIGPKYLTKLVAKKEKSYHFQSVDEFLLTSPKFKS